MQTKTSAFARLGIVGAICTATALAIAAPIPKFVGAQYENGKLVGTVQTGKTKKKVVLLNQVARKAPFLIGEKGDAVIYETKPGTGIEGGHKGEKAAVGRYRVEGEFYVLMEAPLLLNDIREYRSRKGRTSYVISMNDGGAGIPYVYVCSTMGQTWSKRAVRVNGVRNGKLVLRQYPNGEAAGQRGVQPIGTLFLDLDTLLDLDN